jgi:hypothetical protein
LINHFTGARANRKDIAQTIAQALAIQILCDDLDKRNGASTHSLKEDLCFTIPNVDEPELLLAAIDSTAKQLVTATAGQYVDQDTISADFYIRTEGGIRVPMIVAGPGIQANSTNHQHVSIDDWFPSILELAGSKAYQTVQTIDGKSIVPFLKNPNQKDDKKILLWHYPNNWTNVNYHGISWATALRKGNWKLVYFHKTGALELYDLSKDIGKEHDLASGTRKAP